MILEEYTIQNTKIKFYNNNIIEDVDAQKEYIDNVITNLIDKLNNSI